MSGLHQDEFWAERRPSGKLVHFYKASGILTSVCGARPEDVVKVRVHEDPEGDYWAWAPSDMPGFHMIQTAEYLLNMCFPYGIKAAVKAGDGRQVRLRVEEL